MDLKLNRHGAVQLSILVLGLIAGWVFCSAWHRMHDHPIPPGYAQIKTVASSDQTPVWFTKHGQRYHRANCSHAKNSEPTTLAWARECGLTACQRCDP